MGTPNIMLPISEASAREIDLIPTWRYAGCYPQAMELMEACRKSSTMSSLTKLITHRFDGIESVPAALRTACLSMDSELNMVVKVAVTNGV
jgi:L-iditol 2-dehydrogenase